MHTIRITSLIALVALTTGNAFAQDDGDSEPKVVYKERTEIDFEGVEVAGELVKPQGALLLDRKRANFNPLIKLRSDFSSEMNRSVSLIR